MENSNNSRTFTITAKVTAHEKNKYTNITKSHGISFSEWIASILSMYQNGYGEFNITSERENELLTEIDRLEKSVENLETVADIKTKVKEFLDGNP